MIDTPLKDNFDGLGASRYNAEVRQHWGLIQEGKMGEWKTVYADEVEGRWVILKVYETEIDEDGDKGVAVRATVAPGRTAEQDNEQKPPTEADAEDSSITLDPDQVGDLEEELVEIGFSAEAAARIVGKVPV